MSERIGLLSNGSNVTASARFHVWKGQVLPLR